MRDFFKRKVTKNQRGFFLVELIVAVFVFSLVMTLSVGSLVVGIDSNKKTQTLKSVLNNLDIALDTMTKAIAVGTKYHCGSTSQNPPSPQDCDDGGNAVTFLFNEDLNNNGLRDDTITYSFETDENGDGYISRTVRSQTGSAETVRMTAPEVNIQDMKFFVTGSTPSDSLQPKVTLVIHGTSPAGPRNSPTSFMVQTTITQRIPDF